MGEEVIDEVLWTDSAKSSFNNIVEYLEKEWSDREVQKFVNNTLEFLATLKRYPENVSPFVKKKAYSNWDPQ